ncbi:MAG: phosphate propanoyltransferase [Eubacteriaceae bacterium]|nr:phosphate propanoyltransferase [Eubacteriaceae bacterium]
MNKIPVSLSNRHIHLKKEDVKTLFGKDDLTYKSDLSQPGQFACEEQVVIVGPKGSIDKVRILGPVRPDSQVEILTGDCFKLGIMAPIRESGKIEGTPGCKLVGPAGEVELSNGVIVASRHIHMSEDDAKQFGVKDKDIVKVKIGGDRGLVFENVLVRVSPKFALDMHIDSEEGNAAGVDRKGGEGEIVK